MIISLCLRSVYGCMDKANGHEMRILSNTHSLNLQSVYTFCSPVSFPTNAGYFGTSPLLLPPLTLFSTLFIVCLLSHCTPFSLFLLTHSLDCPHTLWNQIALGRPYVRTWERLTADVCAFYSVRYLSWLRRMELRVMEWMNEFTTVAGKSRSV